MQTGDMVQWYFDFEEPMFETKATNRQGERTNGNMADGPHIGRKRQYMDEKTFGVGKGYGQQFQQIKDTKGVVRIKVDSAYSLTTRRAGSNRRVRHQATRAQQAPITRSNDTVVASLSHSSPGSGFDGGTCEAAMQH